MIKLLIVDDSALVRRLMTEIFSAEADFAIRVARNGLEALEALRAFAPDVVTLDVRMPLMDGLSCLNRIMVEHPCPVVMVSSLTAADADHTLEALALGAIDFVTKPTGAISLTIGDIAPELVAKVRAAAGARLRPSLRLRERVRHRIGRTCPPSVPAAAPSPPDKPADAPGGEGLVLIGVSTGGPPALEILLAGLGADFRWPILIAQHMPASFTGPLARRLDGLCALAVGEVTRATPLRAGNVYFGRGDTDLIVSKRSGGLIAMAAPAAPAHLWHPSVERLVRSALRHVPARQLIGVLLTGMGNDGAAAMTELRAQGGRTIAEAKETAVVWGMPGELVAKNGADRIVPLPAIAAALRRWVP